MLNHKARIAVLVSGGGTNLQALLAAQTEGRLKSGKIVLVVSNRADAYALERARLAAVKAIVVTRSGRAAEAFESELLSVLEAEHIDLIVLAGFMCILSSEFVSHYPRRIINIHPALIPSFCGEGFYGLHVHEAALAYGVKVTGATVHFVNEVPDGGEIIMQRAVDILPEDTAVTLQKRVMEQAEWVILPEAAELVARGIVESKEKDNECI